MAFVEKAMQVTGSGLFGGEGVLIISVSTVTSLSPHGHLSKDFTKSHLCHKESS